ncbi:MAG: hypothetical protein HC844_16805, partial [Tabrizicola sp.]|nr:hypothetical protein [Tabrizicola sp.]
MEMTLTSQVPEPAMQRARGEARVDLALRRGRAVLRGRAETPPSSEHLISDAVTGGGDGDLDGQVTVNCAPLG